MPASSAKVKIFIHEGRTDGKRTRSEHVIEERKELLNHERGCRNERNCGNARTETIAILDGQGQASQVDKQYSCPASIRPANNVNNSRRLRV